MAEDSSVYIKKFKLAFIILGVSVGVFGLLVSKIVPVVQNIVNIQNETKTQTSTLESSEKKLADLKAEAERKKIENSKVLKMFFKPIEMSLDTEAVMSDEFGEILILLRDNKIKTRSAKYDYDPKDDNFVKSAGDRFSACKLDLEMVANYTNFEKFLRDLYKHEHFLEISKIEISPYEKNKRILLINMQIKLYAEKDPSQRRSEPQSSATPAENSADGANPSTPEAPPQEQNGGVSPELAE